MAYAGEERRLLWESAGVRHYRKSIHLKAVVIMESERFVLDHPRIKLEARSGKTISAAGMAAVEDWHIIFLCHCIDGVEKTEEVLLGVDVLFTMGTEQNVFALLESKALVMSLASISARFSCRTSAIGEPVTYVRSLGRPQSAR